MAMRLKSCTQCGCRRTITVIGDIQDSSTSAKTQRMCMPCFLGSFTDIKISELPEEIKTALYETVKD